ncbi:hypothetical protein [Corallococcus sp. 4LFB]|uniref:hypothetical protein n=1 Tax=Corallococcus sp. 4LFB TaxID=3383249 RepID=UPI00397667B3
MPNPHGNTDSIDPLPDPEAQGGSVGRAPRRLTVAQLKESIRIAVGMEWDELEARAQSLGRADYALITTENTEPNLVFARFLDDGARKVCIAQAQKDIAQADVTLRTLGRTLPSPMSDLTKLTDAQVNETLVYLSTRFWGAPSPVTSSRATRRSSARPPPGPKPSRSATRRWRWCASPC